MNESYGRTMDVCASPDSSLVVVTLIPGYRDARNQFNRAEKEKYRLEKPEPLEKHHRLVIVTYRKTQWRQEMEMYNR